MPTLRVVLGLMLWPLACVGCVFQSSVYHDAIDTLAEDMSALAQVAIVTALRAEADAAGARVIFFDEASAMMQLSDDVAATAAATTFWKDGHHPAQWVHQELANRAASVLTEHGFQTTRAASMNGDDAVRLQVRYRRKSPSTLI